MSKNRNRNRLAGIASLALVFFLQSGLCFGQVANLALNAADSAADSAVDPAGDPVPQATPKAGNPISRFTANSSERDRNGPVRESRKAFQLGTKYLNGVFGGFEQGAGLGFGLELTTADRIPGVELRATALTSTKLYRRFELEAYVPHVVDKATHIDLWFSYLRRTKDHFYGIGPRIPDIAETNFDLEERSFNGILAHDFAKKSQIGLYAQVSNTATYRGQDTTEPPIDQLFSGNPDVVPVTLWVPGLRTNVKLLRYGGFAELDMRTNSHGLTRGGYLYGRVGSADGFDNPAGSPNYSWLEGEFDARGYIPLGGDKTSLALRGYSELKHPRGGSQIPFYDLSFLGGRTYVRGFHSFRFRANNLLLFSAELRRVVWAQKEDRGIDVFGFGDAGQVWGDNRSNFDPRIISHQDFDSANWRGSVGGGVEYRYGRGLAARFEVGHSNESNLMYFSISRGF